MVAFILIGLYVILALVKINYPGVHYDEILFGNAALGMTDNVFIEFKIGRLPVLLMPYIGALKAYLYYPIFQFFGVSAYSIRIPVILATACALFILYRSVVLYFNDRTARLSLLLLAIDPSFVAQTRYDVGPTVIEFFLKAVALYFFARLIRSRSGKHFALLYLVLMLGLFNKLNFIWFINSFYGALVVLYWRQLKESLNNQTPSSFVCRFVLFLLSYALLAGYFFFINISYDLFQPLSLGELKSRLINLLVQMKAIITGENFFEYALGNIHIVWNDVFFAGIVLIILGGTVFYIVSKNTLPEKKSFYFIGFLLLTTLLQVFLTKQAGSIWHYFNVYPALPIIVSCSLLALDGLFPLGKRKSWIMGIIIIIIAHHLYLNYRYIQSYDGAVKNVSWSKKIYTLIEFTRNDPHQFASIDWGIHAQLSAFNHLPNKYIELSFALRDMRDSEENKAWLASELLGPQGNRHLIAHAEENTYFSEARSNLWRIAKERDFHFNVVQVIADDNGKVIFEIYAPRTKGSLPTH
jgi:4-amino-4-deoxy-L-arabinose transferase-like glycosyltransferase